MPGRLFLTTPPAEVEAWLGAGAGTHADAPRRNIAPGQNILVCTPDMTLMPMRWGMIPVGRKNARGHPVMKMLINARGETVFDKSAFDGVGRGLVPCNGWYEWTGEKRRKQPWRIRPKAGGLIAFAAITDTWAGPGGISVDQAATVTCEPNATVRDIHHRMGVILPPDLWGPWLAGDDVPLDPADDDLLAVEKADDVDWEGA